MVAVLPSSTGVGALSAAVGLTLIIVMVLLGAVPAPASLSVAVSETTYVPSSLGVKLKLAAAPVANGLPFLVTLQA